MDFTFGRRLLKYLRTDCTIFLFPANEICSNNRIPLGGKLIIENAGWKVNFCVQLFLQTCIVATGNFGHSNILIVALLLSLLDDRFFYGTKKGESGKTDIVEQIFNVALWAGVIYAVVKLYGLKYIGGVLQAEISKNVFRQFKLVLSVFFRFY